MIRPYHPNDKETLLEIFKLNTPKYFDKSELSDFEEYLKKWPDTYLTVVLDDIVVGGIGYYVRESDRSGRITWIFFDPKYAGKGLGRGSVEHCLRLLSKDHRVQKFIVNTSQLAYQFFEKFDYQVNRTEKDYWGVGLDLYEMEKANT